MSSTVSSKKMVELVRRLTQGTEREIVTWQAGNSDDDESYSTTVSDTNIVIEGSGRTDRISVAVLDPNGRVLANIDSETLADSGERKAMEDLFHSVRLKSGGINRYIDGVLDQIPKDTLRSL